MTQEITRKAPSSNAPIILKTVIADQGDLGPAMQALPTDRQRAFVVAMLQYGMRGYGKAALAAGFTGDDNTLRVTGHRLAHDARIQEAIREEGQRMLGASVGLGVDFLTATLENPIASTKDRLRAVELLFNRTGLPAQTEHKVTVEHKMSEEEKELRIAELAKKHGLNIDELLGQKLVDVTPNDGTAGLEDLLA